ncbi:hypothetical protein HDU93_000645, partial [Gonapodya sp. JEL0774]
MDVFRWRDKIDRKVIQHLREIATDHGASLQQKLAISTYGQDAIDVLDRLMTSEEPTNAKFQFAAQDLRAHLQRKMVIDKWRIFGGQMAPEERRTVPLEEWTYLFSLFADSTLEPNFVRRSIDDLANEIRSSVEVEDGQLGKARAIVKQLFE